MGKRFPWPDAKRKAGLFWTALSRKRELLTRKSQMERKVSMLTTKEKQITANKLQ